MRIRCALKIAIPRRQIWQHSSRAGKIRCEIIKNERYAVCARTAEVPETFVCGGHVRVIIHAVRAVAELGVYEEVGLVAPVIKLGNPERTTKAASKSVVVESHLRRRLVGARDGKRGCIPWARIKGGVIQGFVQGVVHRINAPENDVIQSPRWSIGPLSATASAASATTAATGAASATATAWGASWTSSPTPARIASRKSATGQFAVACVQNSGLSSLSIGIIPFRPAAKLHIESAPGKALRNRA